MSLTDGSVAARTDRVARDRQAQEPRRRRWAGFALLRRDVPALMAVLFLGILVVAALLVPLLVGPEATTMDLSSRNRPPMFNGGSSAHPLGTDPLGRDLLVRIVLAARVSLGIAAVVVALSVAIGTTLGMIAGYYGGIWDDIMMRLVDLVMGFPSLLLVMVIIYAFGPGLVNLALVLVLTRWVLYARVTRADVLKLRRFEYVEAAHSMGASHLRIMVRHLFPNLLPTLVTLAILEVSVVILVEAGLSFLGLGVSSTSWGRLIAEGRDYIANAWWLVTFPGVAIFLTTTALALFANWGVILLDPAQRARAYARFRASGAVR